ncbi:Protein of unknown function DUF1394 [Nannochloropsis gaditana]|uniref:CYRIA/CYRIB Rac1 binding domain-containing protein n=1 Tax=Nannochloropsis gaditana TaxID=72520 RepID=W7TKW8_9STRA|nr:Protein of unknown function DUF1394 [Nannochloropsis gaditana]
MGQLMSIRGCAGGSGGDIGADELLLDHTCNDVTSTAGRTPTDDVQGEKLHQIMKGLLQESVCCIRAVREYQDNTELLRAAMKAPSNEALQLQAFACLMPSVANIKRAHALSICLSQELPQLLSYLIARRNNLRRNHALMKVLADILDFSLSFDFEKMRKPSIQNDFSYFRRYLNKMAPRMPDGEVQVQEAEAGMISLFIAQGLPMTVTVEKALRSLGEVSGSPDSLCHALQLVGLLANVSCDLALRPGLGVDLRRFALRVMTSSVVIYDRVSEAGVFTRRSPVRTRKCLRILRKEEEASRSDAMLARQLLDSVKYSTLHYKDCSTPSYIRSLLND